MPRRRATIADLLAQGRVERIAPDLEEALDLLATAETHLSSAEKLREDDPAGAYQLLYDAARKAAAADMLAAGFRAKSNTPGAHAAVVLYAEESLAAYGSAEALANFDRMRRSRNRTEYGVAAVSSAQLNADLEHARKIVRAARARIADESKQRNASAS